MDGLAVELRIQIFEELLHFDHPIRRMVKPPQKSHRPKGNKYKDYKAPNAKFSINTAILVVSKKIHSEALPVLYKLNRFVIKHDDICTARLGTTLPYAADLLEHVLLSKEVASFEAWNAYSGCKYGTALVVASNRDTFPKLKSVKVAFDNDWRTSTAAKNDLKRTGMDVQFTAVGRFQVTNHPSGIKLEVEYPALLTAWKYCSGLPRKELRALLEWGADGPTWKVPNELFALGPLGTKKVIKHFAAGLSDRDRSFRTWRFDLQDQSPETYQKVTDQLMRMARGPRMSIPRCRVQKDLLD